MLDLNEIPVAEGTRKTYLNALANLDKWLRGRPVTDENLAGYLSYLYDKGKSPSYAAGAVAAARWRCDCEDKDDPRGKLTRRALKSFRRKAFDRGRGQVTGLPFEAVKKLVTHARGEKTLAGYRDAVICSVMSVAMLRISEAVAVDIAHIDFDKKTLFIPRSKTDQEGRGETRHLNDQALESIRVWMEKAKVKDGPLFRAISKTYQYALKGRLFTDTIRKLVQARCKQVGIEGRISGHSFRVGSAQSLALRGASLVELQIEGRWTSPNMPAHYAAGISASQGAMARLRDE